MMKKIIITSLVFSTVMLSNTIIALADTNHSTGWGHIAVSPTKSDFMTVPVLDKLGSDSKVIGRFKNGTKIYHYDKKDDKNIFCHVYGKDTTGKYISGYITNSDIEDISDKTAPSNVPTPTTTSNTTSKPNTTSSKYKEGWYTLDNSFINVDIYNDYKLSNKIGQFGRNSKVYYYGGSRDYKDWYYVYGKDTTGKYVSGYIFKNWLFK